MHTVEPITSRQAGELARLLEERGVGKQGFQKLIEQPDRVVELLERGYVLNGDPSIGLNVKLADILNNPESWIYRTSRGDPSSLYRVGTLFRAAIAAIRSRPFYLEFEVDGIVCGPTVANLITVTETELRKQFGVGETMIDRLQSWLEYNNLPRLKRF